MIVMITHGLGVEAAARHIRVLLTRSSVEIQTRAGEEAPHTNATATRDTAKIIMMTIRDPARTTSVFAETSIGEATVPKRTVAPAHLHELPDEIHLDRQLTVTNRKTPRAKSPKTPKAP